MMFFGSTVGAAKAAKLHVQLPDQARVPEDSGGIYVFVKTTSRSSPRPLYVRQAANLRARQPARKWAGGGSSARPSAIVRIATEEERRLIEKT
jgi:hypothetical protein